MKSNKSGDISATPRRKPAATETMTPREEVVKKEIRDKYIEQMSKNFKTGAALKFNDTWDKLQSRSKANIHSTTSQSIRKGVCHPNLYKYPTSTPGGGIHTSEVFYKAPSTFVGVKGKALPSGTSKNILNFGVM